GRAVGLGQRDAQVRALAEVEGGPAVARKRRAGGARQVETRRHAGGERGGGAEEQQQRAEQGQTDEGAGHDGGLPSSRCRRLPVLARPRATLPRVTSAAQRAAYTACLACCMAMLNSSTVPRCGAARNSDSAAVRSSSVSQ